MLDKVLFHLRFPLWAQFVKFACYLSQLLGIEGFVDFTEPAFPQKAQQLILTNFWPVRHPSRRVDFPIFGMLFIIQEFVLFNVKGLLLLQPLESLVQMGLFSREEMHLRGQRVLPLFRILHILFVRFLHLHFLAFLELVFLPYDRLDLLLNLPDLSAVHPEIGAFLLDHVLSQPDLVVADAQSHLVPTHSVQYGLCFQHFSFHFVLECQHILVLEPQLLLEHTVLLFEDLIRGA